MNWLCHKIFHIPCSMFRVPSPGIASPKEMAVGCKYLICFLHVAHDKVRGVGQINHIPGDPGPSTPSCSCSGFSIEKTPIVLACACSFILLFLHIISKNSNKNESGCCLSSVQLNKWCYNRAREQTQTDRTHRSWGLPPNRIHSALNR